MQDQCRGKLQNTALVGSENQSSDINHVAIRREQVAMRLLQAELSFWKFTYVHSAQVECD